MTEAKREISPADILSMAEFARVRDETYAEIRALKHNRRVAVGPFATFYFENYRTMWWQVHEMLRIEGGGAAQLPGELEAYNPLIPQGRELVVTLMFELEDPVRRDRELGRLGGVEAAVSIEIDGESSAAVAETDAERSTADGRASSVHFLRFPLTAAQAAGLKRPGAAVRLAIAHPAYGHIALVAEPTRAELAKDLD